MNMGTSGRSACTSLGNFLLPSVAEGNKLASRKLGHFLFMQHVWVTKWEVVYTKCEFNLSSSTPPFKRHSLGRFHGSKDDLIDDGRGLSQWHLHSRATQQFLL